MFYLLTSNALVCFQGHLNALVFPQNTSFKGLSQIFIFFLMSSKVIEKKQKKKVYSCLFLAQQLREGWPHILESGSTPVSRSFESTYCFHQTSTLPSAASALQSRLTADSPGSWAHRTSIG